MASPENQLYRLSFVPYVSCLAIIADEEEEDSRCRRRLQQLADATRLLTLFTTFRNSPDRRAIHRNTIDNWAALRSLGLNGFIVIMPSTLSGQRILTKGRIAGTPLPPKKSLVCTRDNTRNGVSISRFSTAQQTWNWVIGLPGQWVIWVIFHVRVTGSSF